MRGMKLEEQVMLAVCHAVSAGYANMVRRTDGIQNAAALLEALHVVHDKAPAVTYCSSKHLRSLQGAITQVEALDGISGKSTAQLKRLRNLLQMGARQVRDEAPHEGARGKTGTIKGTGKGESAKLTGNSETGKVPGKRKPVKQASLTALTAEGEKMSPKKNKRRRSAQSQE